MKKKLSPPQEIFCREYLVDLNATRAYLAVYAGAKESSAAESGSRLLRNVKVAARLQELMEERNERLAVNQDWVVTRLKRVAEQALVGVRTSRRGKGTQSLSRPDYAAATRALELLGKHVGLFRDLPPTQVQFVVEVPGKESDAAAWQLKYGTNHKH
jgi:phage terminase small subunit